jgi:hypothetical protein
MENFSSLALIYVALFRKRYIRFEVLNSGEVVDVDLLGCDAVWT